MFMNSAIIAASEQRFKEADFVPAALDKKLGDGPIPDDGREEAGPDAPVAGANRRRFVCTDRA